MNFPDSISYEDLYELLCIRHRTYVSLADRERMNAEWAKTMEKKYFKNLAHQNNLKLEDLI